MFKKLTGLLLLTASWSVAATIIFVTPPNSQDPAGDSVSAMATLVTGNGTITITLTNLQPNIHDAGQTLSDLKFTLDSAPPADLSDLTTPTGALVNVTGIGPAVSNTTDSITAWKVTSSGAVVHVDSLYNGPSQTIIGPGPFSNPNSSITGNHNPYLDQTATFTFNISGITSDTTIVANSFSFGTATGDDITGVVCTTDCGVVTTQATPEPISFVLVGAGLFCAGILRKQRRGSN